MFLYNRHAGDIGNIEADGQGKAEVNITDNIVSLTGEHSVIGRTLEVSILLLKFIVKQSVILQLKLTAHDLGRMGVV